MQWILLFFVGDTRILFHDVYHHETILEVTQERAVVSMNPRTFLLVAIVALAIIVVVVLSQSNGNGGGGILPIGPKDPPCRSKLAYNGQFNRLITGSHHWIFTYMMLSSIVSRNQQDASLKQIMAPYIQAADKKAQEAWATLTPYYARASKGAGKTFTVNIPIIVLDAKSQVDSQQPLKLSDKHSHTLASALVEDIGGEKSEAVDTSQNYLQLWEKVHSQFLAGDIDGAYDTFAEIEKKSMEMAAYMSLQAAQYDFESGE